METGCLLHCLEVEETNVFEAVKGNVTTRQAAEMYGIEYAVKLYKKKRYEYNVRKSSIKQ